MVVLVSGEFDSFFAQRPAIEGESEEAAQRAEASRRTKGEGKLLVVGSALGLEGLSAARIFRDLDMFAIDKKEKALRSMDLAARKRELDALLGGLQKYDARIDNWGGRVYEVENTRQDTSIFLPNILDWAAQNEAVASLRAKGYVRRPLDEISDAQRSTLRLFGILLAPLLFLAFGIVRWQIRRRRRPTL